MNNSKILVFSDEPRGRVFVGELERIKEGYSFTYDNDYMARSTATPLGPDLPFSLKPVTSKRFFESLLDLIPDRNNPAYEEYCRSVGVDFNEKDPMVLLTHFGGGPSRFVFEAAPDDALPTGEQALRFRESLGLSQRQLANFLAIPLATLQVMEKDSADVTTARRLMQILIENPSVLWKVIRRRGLYLSNAQVEVVRGYIRKREERKGEAVLEKQKKYRELGYIEAFHNLENSLKLWSQIELLEAARRSKCRNTGWPIGVVLEREGGRPLFKSKGLEAEIESGSGSYDEWSLNRNGAYYFFRIFEEDRKTKPKCSDYLYFDTRIWRIAEILLHCENLYRELGVGSGEVVEIQITHGGLKKRKLAASNPMRDFSLHERWCEEETVQWSGKMTLRDLKNNRFDYVLAISKELFVLFDGWQPDPSVVEGAYEEFMKSNI